MRHLPPALLSLGLALIVSACGGGAVATEAAPGGAAPEPEGAWIAYLAPESACPGRDDFTAAVDAQEQTMLCLVNWARARHGAAPLATSVQLMDSATMKAADIVRCGDFAHDACGAPARETFDRTGYGSGDPYAAFGENIAVGSDLAGSPRHVLNGWLNSEDHRSNLLRLDWREQGIALVHGERTDGSGALVWASHFGKRS